MTSKLTREQLHERARENVKALKMASRQHAFESAREEILADLQLAELALAAMDSEPYGFTDGDRRGMIYEPQYADRLNNPLPVYRHAQPDPETEHEPIAWLNDAYLARGVVDGEAGSEDAGPGYIPVYREASPAQPAPVVPEDVLDALQKVARIRLDLNDFDGDRRGIADCLGDAEEALIEVVNRRAAMLQESQKSAGESNNCRSCENVQDLQAGNSPAQGGSRCSIKAAPALDSSPKTADARCGSSPVIPDCWIPVSERMPEETEPFGGDLFSPDVLTQNQDGDMHVCCTQWGKWIHKKFPGDVITHWQNLPPEAREVKDE